jgi:diguanylate cyclase (GGDEF)-like protein
MTMPIVTEQVEPSWPKSRNCRDACLIYIYPKGAPMGTRYLLNGRQAILGRGDECDIVVQDQSVSRRHTRFDLDRGSYLVTDLGSTNGTFINDEPADRTPLADGDYLRVGNCLFRFLAGGNVEADYHEELYRLAIIDALTGLHNKRYLMDYLERELARSARHGRSLSLILFDIDHFKSINDTLGHLAGDLTLRELAACLQAEVCRDDLLARYGGEEFIAVLTETTLSEAVEVAERFRRAVEGHEFTFESSPLRITISLGVATTRGEEGLAPSELIRRADELLYQSKSSGRNRVSS